MPSFVLTALVAMGLVSFGAFIGCERRLRPRWVERAVRERTVGPPYRATTERVLSGERAPRVVRAASLTGVVLGSVAVPGVIWAMVTLRFDGIALSLLPALASTLGAWCSGWLLLARRPMAVDLGRTTALVSQASSVMLL